jgi:ring-1,2-phenylacetyl-CoA epoxidase subunit PaaB
MLLLPMQKKERQKIKLPEQSLQFGLHMHIRKLFYGDIPDEKTGGSGPVTTGKNKEEVSDWPLWEVFIRSKQGLDHKHVGSLHAADAQMAIENARDVYTRRMEGISIWVVESKYIHASNPEKAGELFEPAADKIYRHPTFYQLPDEVNKM